MGMDEVGRGPLAGPVVCGATALKTSSYRQWCQALRFLENLGVHDSKKLSRDKRAGILQALNLNPAWWQSGQVLNFNIAKTIPLSFALYEVSSQVIDQINIHHASLQGMEYAYKKLVNQSPTYALIDGRFTFSQERKNVFLEAVIKGDERSLIIGLTSLLIKEYRDQLMRKYAQKYPEYGFEHHYGYPTQKHRQAIKLYGITPWHRRTFKGVVSP